MKSELQRPEVEELSDLQWARLERALWTRLDAEAAEAPVAVGAGLARRRRGIAIAGSLALVAAVLLAVFVSRRPQEARVIAQTPARVVTGESATAISFADAAIEVEGQSALSLSGSAEAGATVVLERGGAGFRVAPRATAFVVVAGDAIVRVVGTRFTVARDGAEVEVAVREGQVDVSYHGRLHRVVAGSRWESRQAAQTEILFEDAGASASSELELELEGDAPTTTVEDAGPAAVSSRSRDERRRRAKRVSERTPDESTAVAEEPEVIEAPEAPAVSSEAAEDSARAAREFSAAARLESAQPQEALHRYLVLAQRGDRWGANALFAAARLAFDLGERERGASLANAYLRRFPRGLNAVDARALLSRGP
ncbi:MAG: FecR family protein [Kofleriaceae bacterium]